MVFPAIAFDGSCTIHDIVDELQPLVIGFAFSFLIDLVLFRWDVLQKHDNYIDAKCYCCILPATCEAEDQICCQVDEWSGQDHWNHRQRSLNCLDITTYNCDQFARVRWSQWFHAQLWNLWVHWCGQRFPNPYRNCISIENVKVFTENRAKHQKSKNTDFPNSFLNGGFLIFDIID